MQELIEDEYVAFPRIGGGDPVIVIKWNFLEYFSPHRRG